MGKETEGVIMEQPKIDIYQQVMESLSEQQRAYYAELEERIIEWAGDLADDQELYVIEERKKPEVKDNGRDLVDMTIMMEVEYSPLIVKKGTDIAHFDFLRDGRDRTLYGPVTKETLNKWIDEHILK